MHFITSITGAAAPSTKARALFEVPDAKVRALFPAHTVQPVRLPQDELRHPHTMEWWYFIAYMTTASGARMSLLCSAIRKRIPIDVTNCMLKITDHERGPWPFMECAQLFKTGYSHTESPLSFKLDYQKMSIERLLHFDGGWTIDGRPGCYRLHGKVRPHLFDDRHFDLVLKGTSPAILLCNNTGVMDYGDGYRLAYYVRPKIEVSGTFEIDNRPEKVSGFGWFERQWGDWPGDKFGWRYLNIHLDGGEQWLIFSSQRNGLEKYYAARFPREGGIREYDVRPEQYQEVSHGGELRCGTDVRVETREAALDFSVRPLHPDDPRLNSRYPLMPTIWEGLSSVECKGPNGIVKGIATTEIKPYE